MLLSCHVQDFFLFIFSFQIFGCDLSWFYFFGFILFGFFSFLNPLFCLLPIWEVFRHYFFDSFFSPILFLLGPWDPDNMIVITCFVFVPQVSESLIFFFFTSVFCLFYRLDNLYCFIFEFTASSVSSIMLQFIRRF